MTPVRVRPWCPYSRVRIGERKAMSDATYRFRHVLIDAGALLHVV